MLKNVLLRSLGLLLLFVTAQQISCDPDSAASDQESTLRQSHHPHRVYQLVFRHGGH